MSGRRKFQSRPTDPCDNYGDCASASIAYARANPDDSLYLGDQFTILLQTMPGAGGISCGNGCSQTWSGSLSSVMWSYDQSVFNANLSDTSARFIVITNATDSYTISATATFLVAITTCVTDSNGKTACSQSNVPSPITVSEQVQARAFILTLRTSLST